MSHETHARDLLARVCATLRPPDEPVARVRLLPPRRPGEAQSSPSRDIGAQPFNLLVNLLTSSDHQDAIASHLISRADLVRIGGTSRALHQVVRGSTALAYLGLFRTPFGASHRCKLEPYQLRSLHHIIAAESPPGWRFGDLRGGVLADDPGLGKTVSVWGTEFPSPLGCQLLRTRPLAVCRLPCSRSSCVPLACCQLSFGTLLKDGRCFVPILAVTARCSR